MSHGHGYIASSWTFNVCRILSSVMCDTSVEEYHTEHGLEYFGATS